MPEKDIHDLRRLTAVYLGGSRRMWERCHKTQLLENPNLLRYIEVTGDTDYDFYATYSEDVLKLLLERGWANTATSSEYYDSEAVEILQKDNFQIVLRNDAEFYKKVFDNIPIWYYHDYLWKRNPAVDRKMIQPILEMLFALHRSK